MSGKQTDQAREGLRETEAGETKGATTGATTGEGLLDEARKDNAPAAEAAEQEAADGPEGRGLSR